MQMYEKMRLCFLYDAIRNCMCIPFIEDLKNYLVEGNMRGVRIRKILSEDEFDETIKLAKEKGLISVDDIGLVTVLKDKIPNE